MTTYIKTGIKGLDALLDKGIPAHSFVLVSGTPGTGKTTLSLQFLLEGAKQFQESGVFFSFEQDKDSIKQQALDLGYSSKLIDAYLTIVHYPAQSISNVTTTEILSVLKRKKAKRVVLDSITTLAINAPPLTSNQPLNEFSIKKFIYSFVQTLKENTVATALLISQSPSKEAFSVDGAAEFLCDGIFQCRFESMGGENSRSLQIRKMRSVNHDDAIYPLQITARGVIVHGN